MTKLYATVLFIFSSFFANAQAINKLLKDSNIKDDRSWSQERFPITGDTVVIPASAVYTIKEDVDLSNQDVYVKVEGRLVLDQASIKLSKNSEMVLTSQAATISADRGKGNSIIFVGAEAKYKGSTGLEMGPAYLNQNVSTFTPFVATALPVKFIGFTVSRSAGAIGVQWSTAAEVGASHYEVERSEDGTSWRTIGSLAAAGNSAVVNHYAYTDRTPVSRMAYYRIRQVDADGRATYTAVKTIMAQQTATAEKVAISSTATGHVLVQFARECKTAVQVRIVSLSGQVVAQQEYRQVGSQIVVQQPGAPRGAYIVCLSDGAGLKVAKQVML